MKSNDSSNTERNQIPAESGYGSPTPEDEMPERSPINLGSADPTLRGQENDELVLGDDESLSAPDRNFFGNEEAGSDGELGAGRLGGTDDQFREELARVDDNPVNEDSGEPTPLDAPSTDAPLNADNSGPTRTERESFSSESETDASGSA